jgi:ATP-binding cassette, subfamily C, bacterial LapB
MSQDLTIAEPPRRFARWMAEPMLRNRSTFGKVALAATLINIFGLVTSLYSMTVYDRVLPNNAISSLIGLSIGLLLVVVFDLIMRTLRAYFVDLAAMNVDRDVGHEAFRRLLGLRLDLRKGSTGALSGIIRELETLRDFFASATLSAIIDVPFIVLTLFVIALIGGWLVLVPLAAIPIVLIAGWATYPAMDRLSAQTLGEGLNKQAVLVETIGGLETVKATGAGTMLGQRWLRATDTLADVSMRQRLIASIGINVANAAQTLAYAGVIVAGMFMIESRDLTTGGLIACSLLASRAVAPLSQIAQLMSRLTSVRTAYRQLNVFMQQPAELPDANKLRPAKLSGLIEFRQVSFRYPQAAEDALDKVNLTIRPGERVGILGRVGSGKSTLARLALGLYQPTSGLVLHDGTDVRQLDAEAMRAQIGVALQDSVLFTGSLRENITLGRQVDDEELLRVARLTGVHDFVGRIANGYDLRLADRGESLSGGQRQSIALARALIGKPPVILLDEPTSAMDVQTEAALLSRLETEVAGRTLVLISHRPALLRLVSRIVIVHEGKINMDGPRDDVLRRITQPVPIGAAPPAASTAA